MNNVESLGHYNELTTSFGGRNANCYFFSADIENFIKKKKLFYRLNDKTLLFFVREPYYYRMCFLYKSEESIKIEKLDLPVVASFTGNIKTGVGILEKSGFTKHAETFMMTSDNTQAVKGNPFDMARKLGLVLRRAASSDMNAHHALVNENFDVVASLIGEEIKGEHYVICNSNGVIGTLNFELAGKTAILHRVCAASKGVGIGGILENLFLFIAQQRGCTRSILWVIADNYNAQAFHARYGFKPTKHTTHVYVKSD